jgi:large subunit ribosomal protein L21
MKAVITTGGKQWLVEEGKTYDIELVGKVGDKITLAANLTTDGKATKVGDPEVKGSAVVLEIVDEVKEDKVVAIRYKAKKRVDTRRGHRQLKSRVQVVSIK